MSRTQPLFSIVIPTWNRVRTLYWTLRTCLEQGFPTGEYEVIVSDNASTDGTGDMVRRLSEAEDSDGVIQYHHTGRLLCLSSSWEYAVAQARGDYVLVIGSDDGLMPGALSAIDHHLRAFDTPVLRWNRVYYTWPDKVFEPRANLLQVPVGGSNYWLDGRQAMREIVAQRMDYTMLPMLYTAAIHKSLIASLRERTGRVFASSGPDVYSGFAFACLAGQYPSIGLSLSINGASDTSIGFNAGLPDPAGWIREQAQLTIDAGYHVHPRVDAAMPEGMRKWLADSFEWAKDLLAPEDSELVIDYNAARVPDTPGFDGQVIEVKCDEHDVHNVYEASRLASTILESAALPA